MIFGLYFLIFGIIILIAMIKQKDKGWYTALPFIFVGSGVLFVSFIETYPDILNLKFTTNQIATFLIFILLAIVGFWLAPGLLIKILIKKKVLVYKK